MGQNWVTITDNADPMQVQVYRRDPADRADKGEAAGAPEEGSEQEGEGG